MRGTVNLHPVASGSGRGAATVASARPPRRLLAARRPPLAGPRPALRPCVVAQAEAETSEDPPVDPADTLAAAPSVDLRGPAGAAAVGPGGVLPDAPGVYAIYSPAGALEFVGLSRRIRLSIDAHRKGAKTLPLCGAVRCRVVPGGGKDALQGAWKAWMTEASDARCGSR